MKWFKHLVASGDDPDIDAAMIEFGSDGYYVFFRTLEIMSREFDVADPGQNTFYWEYLRKRYRISPRKLLKILSFFQQKDRIFFRVYDVNKIRMIQLNCPKLKRLCDEYAQKKLVKNRDNVGTMSGRRQQTTDNRQQIKVVTGGGDPRFLNLGGVYLESIVKKCQKIHELQKGERGGKQINIEAWVNQVVKVGAHPKAIDYSLDHLINRWKGVLDPWPYIQAIFQLQNGNFWEQEHIKESESFKVEWESLDEKLQGLIEKINMGGADKS